MKTLIAFAIMLMGSAACAESRPNIIVIMADDLGYADVGFNGCSDIPTPNIDSLADDGARFSSGYVTGPMCGPSRAGFITGQIQSRFGWHGNPNQPLNPTHGLPTGIKTVAHWMQQQGYATGGVGKWHMGTTHDQHPNALGFDDWYGFLSGGRLYYPMDHPSYNGKYLRMKKPWGMRDMHHTMPIIHNQQPLQWEQYLTRELTDYGIGYIEENQGKPFFLFMSYNAPHEYLEAPEETIAKFPASEMTKIPGVKPQARSIYAAMVDEMDQGIGKLLETLDRLELSQNTVVWFLSDNGGMKRTSDNRPLRGAKWDSFEGGLRVPMVVRWPTKVKPGTVLDHPVTSLDIGATAIALAGGDLSKTQLDGADITDYMTGQTSDAPHDELFWRTDRKVGQKSGVLRVGDFKLIVQKNEVQLFNLKDDLSETTDLSKSQPERVQTMLRRWQELDQQSKPSYFESTQKGKNAYQYADYQWLKGTPHYRASEN
ncbi:sulfatase-like hydrolase/transferase [Novipirellula caenicola]|uniref:Arylsulfatase n=1 Tax=Novipirellula caenicola TaxID=1536901 RepID=A0ABP9VT09_9BACT